MERRVNPRNAQKRQRRNTIIGAVLVAALVIGLMLMEQIALLYVLGTVSVAGLLIVVAWSDLGGTRRPAGERAAPFDDSAAIADGQTSKAARSRQK